MFNDFFNDQQYEQEKKNKLCKAPSQSIRRWTGTPSLHMWSILHPNREPSWTRSPQKYLILNLTKLLSHFLMADVIVTIITTSISCYYHNYSFFSLVIFNRLRHSSFLWSQATKLTPTWTGSEASPHKRP